MDNHPDSNTACQQLAELAIPHHLQMNNACTSDEVYCFALRKCLGGDLGSEEVAENWHGWSDDHVDVNLNLMVHRPAVQQRSCSNHCMEGDHLELAIA